MTIERRLQSGLVGFVAMGLFTFTACAPAAKRETASLAAAVERYQLSDVSSKSAAAADIRAALCDDPDVARAKGACVSAVDTTAKAMDLKREVETGLDDLEKKRVTADELRQRDLPKKLDDAERLLNDGRGAMKSCVDQVMALRLKYGV